MSYGQIAERLVDNGWPSPIPLNGKRPFTLAWDRYGKQPVEPETLEGWCRRYPRHNVGHPSYPGIVGAVDIDIIEPAQAERVVCIADEILGQTPAVRIGRAPKQLRLYRMTGVASRKAHPVEIFANSGQFVMYGEHPDTRTQYIWLDEEPLSVSPEDLPELSAAAVAEFLRVVAREITPRPAHGGNAVVDLDLFRRLRFERHNKQGRAWLDVLAAQLAAAVPGTLHNVLLSVTGALVRCGTPNDEIRAFIETHFAAPRTGTYAAVWRQVDPAIRGARRRRERDADAFEARVLQGLAQ